MYVNFALFIISSTVDDTILWWYCLIYLLTYNS